MNFLFNSTSYKPSYRQGGPIFSVSALAEALVAAGHSVTVLAANLDLGQRLEVDCQCDHEIEGVRVRYFEAKPTLLQKTGLPAFARAGVFTFGPAFGRWLNDHGRQHDVLDNQITYTLTNGLVSKCAARFLKLSFYHQRGNLDPKRLSIKRWKKAVYLRLRELPIMRRAHLLVALTAYEVETYRRLGLRNRIEIIPNGIQSDLIPNRRLQPSRKIADILDRLREAPTFLFMSRILPLKGPDLFVEGFMRCAARFPLAQAVLVGPDEGQMCASFERQLAAAGLSQRFHYPGAISGDDKLAILQRADAFVLPTGSEGFSMALLEALASRCAIVTTPDAYFPEIVRARAGFIVGRTSVEVGEAMARLLEGGRSAMAEMGGNGWRLAQQYSWPAIAERYAAIAGEIKKQQEVTA